MWSGAPDLGHPRTHSRGRLCYTAASLLDAAERIDEAGGSVTMILRHRPRSAGGGDNHPRRNGKEVPVSREMMRRIALTGVLAVAAGLTGCKGTSWGGGGGPPSHSIESLAPDKPVASTPQEPSAQIRTPAQLAADEGRLQPKNHYAAPPPDQRVHVVKKGETLFGLARKYYGDQRQWRRIYQANRKQIRDPQRIETGMKLVIP